MVSVMAVKIQLSSPRGVRLSFSFPGILVIISLVICFRSGLREMNQRRPAMMGVVRQQVNKSAGRSGCIGSNSLGPQAAS